jgi:hypothetical protein
MYVCMGGVYMYIDITSLFVLMEAMNTVLYLYSFLQNILEIIPN